MSSDISGGFYSPGIGTLDSYNVIDSFLRNVYSHSISRTLLLEPDLIVPPGIDVSREKNILVPPPSKLWTSFSTTLLPRFSVNFYEQNL